MLLLKKKLTLKPADLENNSHLKHAWPFLNGCTYIFSRKYFILKFALRQKEIQNRQDYSNQVHTCVASTGGEKKNEVHTD